MELRGSPVATELPLLECLCRLPALSAWRRPALPNLGGVQSQAAAIGTGPTHDKDLQALGIYMESTAGWAPEMG